MKSESHVEIREAPVMPMLPIDGRVGPGEVG